MYRQHNTICTDS